MPFSSLGLPAPIARGVKAAGYTVPTPIQEKAIPSILPGGDIVAAAQTGSGKTAAFLLPILSRLIEGPRALRALVLVPTRELAAQVEASGRRYARFSGVRVGAVYGGVPIGPQERMLQYEGVELLVATPGRLLDLHGRQGVSLDEIEVLVLDEADRMVDMGFAPDLKRILKLLPENRQTLMFSATMPPALNSVAQQALYKPQRLDLGPPSRPASSINQSFYPVAGHLKSDLLHRFLRNIERPRVIVFARTKRGADRLARRLHQLGHAVAPIHGDRSQGQRDRALRDFKRGRITTLVATDIASRGIDVRNVTHVVNYDVPGTPEDYIHRIGRTGRMENEGEAITLIAPQEEKDVAAIERAIGRTIERVTLGGFDYRQQPRKSSDAVRTGRSGGRGGRRHETGSRGATAVSTHSPSAPAHGRRRSLNPTDRRSRRRM